MLKKLILLSMVVFLFSGCATGMKKDAFGPNKTFAVVNISGYPTITHVDDSSKYAKKVINEMPSLIDKAMTNVKSIKYVPSKVVLNSKYYKNFPHEDATFGPITYHMPKNYNFIMGFTRPKEFAKGSKYDGIFVIQANSQLDYTESQILFIKHWSDVRISTILTVAAVDKNGDTVWTTNVAGQSDFLPEDKVKVNEIAGSDLTKMLEQSSQRAANNLSKLLDTQYASAGAK